MDLYNIYPRTGDFRPMVSSAVWVKRLRREKFHYFGEIISKAIYEGEIFASLIKAKVQFSIIILKKQCKLGIEMDSK